MKTTVKRENVETYFKKATSKEAETILNAEESTVVTNSSTQSEHAKK